MAINITAVNGTANGILEEYADGTATPLVSNLQFGTAAIAEMAIVPVGADGKIDIHGSWGDASETVDVVGDVVGYFSAGTGGQTYHAIAGARIIDTRQTAPVAGHSALAVSQGTTVVAPSPTLLTDVMATDATVAGDFTIYPAGTSIPGTSNLNFQNGLGAINNLDLAATSGGTFDIYNGSSGTVDAVVDFMGYLSVG